MQLEEAVNYLENIDIKIKSYPDTNAPIRGGSSLIPLDDEGQTLVEDPFHIKREGHLWLVTIFKPVAHIIYASEELRNAVFAVENLYRLTEKQTDKYRALTFELVNLQYNGIVTTVTSSRETPAILASCTEREIVEDRFAFMLHHVHLVEKTKPYRIYPYQGRWAIDSPNPNDPSPLKIVQDVSKAAEYLIDLCGRAMSE